MYMIIILFLTMFIKVAISDTFSVISMVIFRIMTIVVVRFSLIITMMMTH